MNKLKYVIYGFSLVVLAIFCSCSRVIFNDTGDAVPIVKVGDEKLFMKDIIGLKEGMTKEDSVLIIKSFAKDWVSKRVFEISATDELGDKINEVDRLVEDYRRSLIVQYYERQNMADVDETVSDKEIEKYYNEHKQNMRFNAPYVKAQMLHIPKKYIDMKIVTTKFMSGKKDNWEDIISISQRDGLEVYDFTKEWTPFSKVYALVPFKEDPKNFLVQGKSIDKTDDNYRYLMKVLQYRLAGDIMPIEMVSDMIRRTIVMERKHRRIEDLKRKSVEKAIEEGIIQSQNWKDSIMEFFK